MYPTIVIALVYFQRSMVNTYDLGIVSTTKSPLSHVAPPEQNTPGTQTAAEDNAPAIQSTEEQDGRRIGIKAL